MRMCINTIMLSRLAPCPPCKSDPIPNPKAANYSTAKYDVYVQTAPAFWVVLLSVDNVTHEVILYTWYKVQRTRYLFVPGTTHLLIHVV